MRAENRLHSKLTGGVSNLKGGDMITFKNFYRLIEDQGCPLVQKNSGPLLLPILNRDSNSSRNSINICFPSMYLIKWGN